MRGDVNNSGQVRSDDAILTLRIVVGLLEPTEYQEWAADVNEDGEIKSNDAILILREAAGLAAPGRATLRQGDATILGQGDGRTEKHGEHDPVAPSHITVALGEAHGVAGEIVIVPLEVDNISGSDLGKDLSCDEAFGSCVYLLYAHLPQINDGENCGFKAVSAYTDDSDVNLVEALCLEGFLVGAIEADSVADLVANQLDVISVFVNCDNLRTVARSWLVKKIGTLAPERHREVKRAVGYALGWEELIRVDISAGTSPLS